MSAGMAGVIAVHREHAVKMDHDCYLSVCTGCHWRKRHSGDSGHAAHVAEELAKAGYGDVPAALLAAADEMPIETLAGADKASVWLRHRAHSQDPEGHALVKAIHDRKAEA